MAFPQVAATAYSEETAADTTAHDVLIPDGTASGDLLLLFIAIDSTPTISNMPAGWTQLKRLSITGGTLEVWYKEADGTEVAFQYTSSSSERSTNLTWRVNARAAATAPEVSTGATSSAMSDPDPDSLTPSWGALDTLWIACFGGSIATSTTIVAYPANYTISQYSDSTGGTSVHAVFAIAGRELNAATEDPGVFDTTGTIAGGVCTIAVKPVAAVVGNRYGVTTSGSRVW